MKVDENSKGFCPPTQTIESFLGAYVIPERSHKKTLNNWWVRFFTQEGELLEDVRNTLIFEVIGVSSVTTCWPIDKPPVAAHMCDFPQRCICPRVGGGLLDPSPFEHWRLRFMASGEPTHIIHGYGIVYLPTFLASKSMNRFTWIMGDVFRGFGIFGWIPPKTNSEISHNQCWLEENLPFLFDD